ncbi:MAG: glycosyltransferase family 2 protein [Cyanobacteria bacterium P01_G01_bin.19]
MTPEVSVIIPTYNSEAYISQALESIFNQTYRNFEIILVDDASTDSTLEIARNFSDERLVIISNQENHGVSFGRNCGIAAAKGNWIALLDSDDWYDPKRIEKLLLAARQHHADLVADDLNLIRDREPQPWSTLLQENEQAIDEIKLIDAVEFVASDRPNPINAKRNWSFGYTKPLMRREFLLDRRIAYDETIHVGEDYILYLECLRQGARFVLLPQACYYYRTRVTSLSTRKPTEYLSDSCDITNIFIHRELTDRQDSRLLDALSKNLIVYQNRLAYYQVIEAIEQRNIIQAVRLILNSPRTLLDLAGKLVSVLLRKIKSKIGVKKPDEVNFDAI